MANSMFCFPNWVDGTPNVAPVIGGGAWDATQALSKIAVDDVNDYAISTTDAVNDTRGDIDLGVARDCRAFVITDHNISNSGLIRVRASDTPAFAGVTKNGAGSIGNATVSLAAGAAGATITAGDILTFAGHSTVYKATATLVISPSSTGTLSISPNLTAGVAGGEAVVCRSGSFASPLYDTGWVAAISAIYAWGSLPWGHPSWWTGQPTAEDRLSVKIPFVRTFTTILARYWRFEIDDTTNPDAYIRLNRIFIARGIVPTYNLAYGKTSIGWLSNTKVSTTNSSRRVYQQKRSQRLLPMEMENLAYQEAFSNFLDMQSTLDIYKQLFFIFDPDDTYLMHRRSFLATIRELNPLSFPYFGVNNVPLELIEVI